MWDQIQQSLHQSMQRVFTKIAMLLPGIVAFIVVLITFFALAALATYIVRRILIASRFDQRLNERTSSLADWAPSRSPTLLIGRVVFWSFLLAGVLVGLSTFEAASTDAVLAGYVFAYLPRIIGAVILLFLGNLVARFLSRSVLIGAVNMNLHYARLLASGVKWLVLVLTAAMVLDHLAIAGVIVDMAFGILFGGMFWRWHSPSA